MSWQLSALLLLGGSTVLLFIGMPVALSFVTINIVGAWLFLGGERRADADRAQQRRLGDELFADADPAFHPDGRNPVPHRPRHPGDRRRRAPHPPGARTACGRRRRGRHGVLGDFGLHHRNHRHARLADAADHAGARLSPDHGGRPDHGDRRRGYADPALGAHRAARQPVRHLDLKALDRRRRSRADPVGRVYRLHHRARVDHAVARAAHRRRHASRLGKLAAARALRHPAGRDLCRRGRRDVGRLRDADGIRRARRARDHGDGRALPCAYVRRADEVAARARWRFPE